MVAGGKTLVGNPSGIGEGMNIIDAGLLENPLGKPPEPTTPM